MFIFQGGKRWLDTAGLEFKLYVEISVFYFRCDGNSEMPKQSECCQHPLAEHGWFILHSCSHVSC